MCLYIVVATSNIVFDLSLSTHTAHIELYRSAPNVAAKYVLWVLFSMVFILFSVGFVNVVSPNAIGEFCAYNDLFVENYSLLERLWYS